jgi:flagellar basal-body rod protein FlgG
MIRGLYTSTAGMVAHMARQVTISNNLANISTTGYKQDRTSLEAFYYKLLGLAYPEAPVGSMTMSPIGTLNTSMGVDQDEIDFSQGQLMETGNALDLALSGPGFFTIATADGVCYTRDGSFVRDASGQLVTSDGARVLGVDGPLVLGEGKVLVEGDGTVLVDGQTVGQLRIADFPQAGQLRKLGYNRFAPVAGTQETPATSAVVNQGFLERSNVDAARSMVEMMEVLRSYEATQRMIQLQDQTLGAAVNQVGTLA